jgi:predicted nucleic acid-binding protein
MIIVLDSSVLIKWFKQEEGTEKALQIREAYINEKIEVAIPDLVFYELSNVLRYEESINKQQVQKAVQSLREMEFQVIAPFEEYTDEMIEESIQKDITVYDSAFYTLSKLLEAEMITSDQELDSKTPDNVKLLQNFNID